MDYDKRSDITEEINAKINSLNPLQRRGINKWAETYIINCLLDLKPESCLEIGTGDGYSAAVIGLTLEHNGQGVLYSVGPDVILEANRLRKELKLDHRVKFIQGYSPYVVANIFSAFQVTPFDFVFIDACHELGAPTLDFRYAMQYANEKCIYLFHDLPHPEVRASVELICSYFKLEFEESALKDIAVIRT